jgi:hypothetical protein
MWASIRSGGNATAEVRRTLWPKTAQVLRSFVRRPGWYSDWSDPEAERYWDGTEWGRVARTSVARISPRVSRAADGPQRKWS